MRKTILIFIALFISCATQAQIFKTYKEGYYYNTSGQKVTGVISFLPYKDHIFFKPDKDGSSEKIHIEDITAVVISRPMHDSLTVMTEENKENKKYFAKFLFASHTTKFYHKFRAYSSGGTPTMGLQAVPNMGSTGSQPAFHNNIVWSTSPSYSGTMQIAMYQEGNTTYEITKNNFIEVLSKAFADAPDLVQRIQNKEFKFKNLDNIFVEYKSIAGYQSNTS